MRRSPEKLKARVAAIDMELTTAPTLKRIDLMQEKININDHLKKRTEEVDMAMVESEFGKHAKAYSMRKGISYSAWSKLGVSKDVLKRAGITR